MVYRFLKKMEAQQWVLIIGVVFSGQRWDQWWTSHWALAKQGDVSQNHRLMIIFLCAVLSTWGICGSSPCSPLSREDHFSGKHSTTWPPESGVTDGLSSFWETYKLQVIKLIIKRIIKINAQINVETFSAFPLEDLE